MRPSQARFVTACQQLLALAAVLAILAPATGVVSLDVVTKVPSPVPGEIEVGTAPKQIATKSAITSAGRVDVPTAPVDPTVTEYALGSADAAPKTGLTVPHRELLSQPRPVHGYGAVGVTWSQDSTVTDHSMTVSVRTNTNGTWSGWQQIDFHDEHGPDPDSAEATAADRRIRAGTDAVLVGRVDQVQIKATITDGVAKNMKLAVIDPGTATRTTRQGPAIDTASLSGRALSPEESARQPLTAAETGSETITRRAGETKVTPKPQIFSRAQWGANEALRDKSSLRYYEVHAGFVHHTVNANNYSSGQVPAIIRGIYAYHTQSRGWSDIGYNFLVDRFGRIWEGRYGGVDRPVVGAHTLGYNDYSFAMSAIGNFDVAQPSSAVVQAYGRLMAWKLSLHGVKPGLLRQKVGDSTFRAINGHRDAGSTACPGRYLYAKLPTIRGLATKFQANFNSRGRAINLAGSAHPDLVLKRAQDGAALVLRTHGTVGFAAPRTSQARGWDTVNTIVSTPDVTGDGRADVLARRNSGETRIYPGNGNGGFGAGIKPSKAFQGYRQITAVGDLNGDRRNDFVAATSTGALHLFAGNGAGGFSKKFIAGIWGNFNATVGIRDFTGDGRNDVMARMHDGSLWLFPGRGNGTLGTRIRMPGVFKNYNLLIGGGDYDGDRRPDLLARKSDGVSYIFPNRGGSSLKHWLGPIRGLGGINLATSPGNTVAGGLPDLVARRGTALVVVPNRNTFNTSAPRSAGQVIGNANVVLNVGDWDRNGTDDLITRTSGGDLWLYPGTGRGTFTAPKRIASGFGGVRLLAAAGDVTGDGYPDLMGQPTNGSMRIYPSNGAAGLKPSYVAHSAIAAGLQVGVGRWDSDGAPDSLFKSATGTRIYWGNGPGGLTTSKTLSTSLNGYDWVISVGNITGNSHGDLIVRERATGYLWALTGGVNGLGERVFLAEGFKGYSLAG